MKDLKGRTAIVTGASRGLGVPIAHALAGRGMNLVLAARSAADLETVRAAVAARGVRAIAVPTDVSDLSSLEALFSAAEREFGAVDVLVNNAGIELLDAFLDNTFEELDRIVAINLSSVMRLTRLALPGMMARGHGHVVNIASMAGLAATAHGEAYCATKHGVVGFTRALRATLRVSRSPVGASAICPGFITDAGMFADKSRATGVSAPAMIGTSTPEKVAAAVIRAIDTDAAELIVNPGPMRLSLALGALFPRLSEWISDKAGAHHVFTEAVRARRVLR